MSILTEAPIGVHKTFGTDFSDKRDSFQEHRKSLSDLLLSLPEETPFFTQQVKDVFVFHLSLNTLASGSSAEHHHRGFGLFTYINHRNTLSKLDGIVPEG